MFDRFRLALLAVVLFAVSFTTPAAAGPVLCEATACEAATASCEECVLCAAKEYCSPVYTGCVDLPDCLAFSVCQDIGDGWDDPDALYAACVAAYPLGALLFGALIDCLTCVSCRGCETVMYDPNPGCY